MWRATVRVQHQRPKEKRTKVEAYVAIKLWFVLLPTINNRSLTGGTNLIWMVVEVASGKDHA